MNGREAGAIECRPAIFLDGLLQGLATSAQVGDGGGGGEVAGDVVEKFGWQVCKGCHGMFFVGMEMDCFTRAEMQPWMTLKI